MEIITYILAVIGSFAIAYKITPILLNRFVGEVLYAKGKDGRNYRILKRPSESEKYARARLRYKMEKAGAI